MLVIKQMDQDMWTGNGQRDVISSTVRINNLVYLFIVFDNTDIYSDPNCAIA